MSVRHRKERIWKEVTQTNVGLVFEQTKGNVWLSTAPGTRAEGFYKRSGWKVVSTHGKGETKFEMSFQIGSNHGNSNVSKTSGALVQSFSINSSIGQFNIVHIEVNNTCKSKFGISYLRNVSSIHN